MGRFKGLEPFPGQFAGGFHAQMFMNRRVFFEVGECELKQGSSRLGPGFLHVNKRAGQLNQAFVKSAVRAVFVLEPQMLQHLMGFVKKLFIETGEIAEVMRVEFLPVMRGDHFGNAFALAHGFRLNRRGRGDETHSDKKIRDSSRRLLR